MIYESKIKHKLIVANLRTLGFYMFIYLLFIYILLVSLLIF